MTVEQRRTRERGRAKRSAQARADTNRAIERLITLNRAGFRRVERAVGFAAKVATTVIEDGLLALQRQLARSRHSRRRKPLPLPIRVSPKGRRRPA
jgi:hypothetical protein